jgi:hypothetical protein
VLACGGHGVPRAGETFAYQGQHDVVAAGEVAEGREFAEYSNSSTRRRMVTRPVRHGGHVQGGAQDMSVELFAPL